MLHVIVCDGLTMLHINALFGLKSENEGVDLRWFEEKCKESLDV